MSGDLIQRCWFDGQEALVMSYDHEVYDVYYGDKPVPEGKDCGYVKVARGLKGDYLIIQWRLPKKEGGRMIVEESEDPLHRPDFLGHVTEFL